METLGYFLILIICAVATGGIGMSKSRSWARWFLIGLLTGPIGLLIAIGVPTNYAAKQRRDLHLGRTRKCPACAEIIAAEALVCRYCGRDVASSRPVLDTKGRTVVEADRARGWQALGLMAIIAVAVIIVLQKLRG